MPVNAEYKAELRDTELARHIARSLGGLWVETVQQVDTYWRIASGRLKRRVTSGPDGDRPAEIILYHRADGLNVRASAFELLTEPAARERLGTLAFDREHVVPPWLTVCKRREVWAVAGVAVHLDDVQGLGPHIEFEAMVTHDRAYAEAAAAVERLRRLFAPAMGEGVSGSYSDMLA